MTDLQRYREGAQSTLDHPARDLKIRIGKKLPLADAAEAHRLLESGETAGSILLRP